MTAIHDKDGNQAAVKATASDGTELGVIVRVASTPTPSAGSTGLALEAGGHLAAIDGKVPALGQAVAAASTPVVLPATQITALTPPAAIVGFALEAGHLATIDSRLDVALSTRATEATLDARTGALTEAAPGTDTASSGINGRLQRIAQRLTSLIALLPAALVGGRLDVNVGAPLGQQASAASIPVVLPAAQITTLTPPAAITGFALDATVAKDATIVSSNTKLDTLHTDLGLVAKDATLTSILSNEQQIASNTAPLPWFAAPQPQPFFVGGP